MDYKASILLFDEDINTSSLLSEYMRGREFQVVVIDRDDEIAQAVLSGKYDCLIMTVEGSRKNKKMALRSIREAGNLTPIITLGNLTDREEIISLYQQGADDYVARPFSMEILLCKVQAMVNRFRGRNEKRKRVYDLGGKQFDSVKMTIGGVKISTRESELLELLCAHANELVDKHVILRSLWQSDTYFAARSLAVYINHVRAFLQDTDCRILAVHGKGYKLINDNANS